MKLLKITHTGFSPTNLHRNIWQDAGVDGGVDSGYYDSGTSSEYETDDFSLQTESNEEKVRLEKLEAVQNEAREKREQLTYKKFNTMVDSKNIEDAKDFCNFIDELCEKYLGITIDHTNEQSTLEQLTEMKEGRLPLKRIEKTLSLVARLDTEMVNFKKVIELKKRSKSYQIKIHEGFTGKIDHIVFNLEDGSQEFFNLELTNIEKAKIFSPIFTGLRGMTNRYDKLTKKEREEMEIKREREQKLARITDAKELASDNINETKNNVYELLTSEGYVNSLPLDIINTLSSPLSQIAQLQSELEVDSDGSYIVNDSYKEALDYEKEQAMNIIDDYFDNSDLSSDEEDGIYEDLDRIEDLFEIE